MSAIQPSSSLNNSSSILGIDDEFSMHMTYDHSSSASSSSSSSTSPNPATSDEIIRLQLEIQKATEQFEKLHTQTISARAKESMEVCKAREAKHEARWKELTAQIGNGSVNKELQAFYNQSTNEGFRSFHISAQVTFEEMEEKEQQQILHVLSLIDAMHGGEKSHDQNNFLEFLKKVFTTQHRG